MILLTRLYLIFLLMLLQFAAPLIHAHTKSVVHFGASVHLPEFEQVNNALSKKHSPGFFAPTNHDEGLVTLSSGINSESSQLSQTENTIFILLVSLIFMVKTQRQTHCFSLETEPICRPFFLNFNAPRAPPYFYVG
ncbi:MAG: hypothetical protein PHN45_11910 [Methylococcales bacterium]|nr:hypothetical protein [Methylococcales bacterium]MDD5755439.1 hypothetical protein [Methylococcales bacterium]